MRKMYLILFIYIVGVTQLSAQYCPSAASSTGDEDITNVSLSTINNTTGCVSLVGTQGTATGTSSADFYSDFTTSTVPVPILTFGQSYVVSASVTPCNGFLYSGAAKAWIDWNRNNLFTDAGEEVLLGTTVFGAATAPVILSNSVTVPTTASVGTTRMRVSFREVAAASLTPCYSGGWGETEDYTVFVGQRKYDYNAKAILSPKSTQYSICGTTPYSVKLLVENSGNQPLTGGQLICNVKGALTNQTFMTSFYSTILPGEVDSFVIGNIVATADEDVTVEAIVKSNIIPNTNKYYDTIPRNDTAKRFIHIYQNPTYTLTSNNTCIYDSTQVTISNFSLPSSVIWSNDSKFTTTNLYATTTSKQPVIINRGVCSKLDSVPLNIFARPQLTMPKDTVLCVNRNTLLQASSTTTGTTFKWNDPNNTAQAAFTALATTRSYTVTASYTHPNGLICTKVDSVKVSVSDTTPYPYTKFNDTVCLGQMATIGFNAPNQYLFSWNGTTLNSRTISFYPSKDTVCYASYNMNGCIRKNIPFDVKVLPLPLLTVVNGSICPNDSTIISASGADSIDWGAYGAGSSIKVSPQVTSGYAVTGINTNGCATKKVALVTVKPKPDLKVYTNKSNNNVCDGDSLIIFATGGMSYSWSNGYNDSVYSYKPTTSQDYTITTTNGYNCTDTAAIRIYLKPSLSVLLTPDTVCAGETATLVASGGVKYNWGSFGTTSSILVLGVKSTNYTVTVTSAYDCEVEKKVNLTVWPKPESRTTSDVVCSNASATVRASGGTSYRWNGVLGSDSYTTLPSATTQIMVEVFNEFNCVDTNYATITVIDTPKITFKFSDSFFRCPNIPITLIATPVGGVFEGTGVELNKMNIQKLPSNDYTIKYTYKEPVAGCIGIGYKTITVVQCSSSILGVKGIQSVLAYPNPFDSKVELFMQSTTSNDAIIQLSDMLGRMIQSQQVKIHPGSNSFMFTTESLSQGQYIMSIEIEGEKENIQLIK